ncbi:hypothetical protein OAT67_09010 [Bacteriovoracaceae bacterium]|nr:hypothetical protein [Bacteriovoracaceae bacterium]
MKKITLPAIMVVLAMLASCSSSNSVIGRWFSSKTDRGYTHEHDAGPPEDSQWAKLFAETPNYRAYGQEVIGGRGEKFRWKFGPMWYRGRLEKNRAKVFVIGQEGAQDENVSNRSFTGSTGTKMQKFLNHLGIYDSYLFMNTFVYTITGQYSLFGEDRENAAKLDAQKRLLWLAQNENSAVVDHRHRLFDYAFETNKDMRLVIGVGTAGKDSAATYANYLDPKSKCSSYKVGRNGCWVKYKGKDVLFIGVPHPGGASPRNGGESAYARLVGAFDKKAKTVLEAVESGKLELKEDPEGKRQSSSSRYRYGNASIPHKDFPFGTNWRMGDWGTTSNRRGSHTIQVFSSGGCYNNTVLDPETGRCGTATEKISYSNPSSLIKSAPAEMAECDVPYESPKACTDKYKEFDKGPSEEFGKVLLSFFEGVNWSALGVTQHMSFGPNGFYRGRAEGASKLVIADQFAHDDFFSGRALSGEVGQRLQGVLNKKRGDYVVVRTAPVDTLDLDDNQRKAVLLNKDVNDLRNEVFKYVMENGSINEVITVGKYAEEIGKAFAKDYKVTNYSEAQVKKLTLGIIPRKDLPAHTRWWMGTSGDRAARAYKKVGKEKVYSGNYYKVYAPYWATRWKSGKLDSSEKNSLEFFENWYNEL